jgi:hypothetical protein
VDLDLIPDITMHGQDDPHGRVITRRPPTVGQLAALVREHTGRPGDWWHHVRFDPAEPVSVRLTGTEDADVWLTAWPPGCRAHLRPHDGDAPQVATLIAGELAEVTIATDGVTERPLRANRVRVFGDPPRPRRGDDGHLHELANPGTSFAITLHASGTARETDRSSDGAGR